MLDRELYKFKKDHFHNWWVDLNSPLSNWYLSMKKP